MLKNPLQGAGENLEFTEEAKAAYLKNSNKCPFCGAEGAVASQSLDFDIGEISNKVYCEDCNKRWWEIFELKTIEPVQP